MSQRAPDSVDRHVGSRVRRRRLIVGMSQEKLGEALGLTFQQVQKYEKGANRIGSGRLQQIAHTLQVPISYFYDGQGEDAGSQGDSSAELVVDKDNADLLRAFNSLEDQAMRQALLTMAQAAAQSRALGIPLGSKAAIA
jgi:transcriptional regulator with XRE-family HTH domain